MDSKNEAFEVKFTDESIKEITEIYGYISNNLKEDNIIVNKVKKVFIKILSFFILMW